MTVQALDFISQIAGWSVWSAVISALVGWLTAKATLRFNRDKLRREFQLEFATERALQALLADGEYSMRSFTKLKRHLPAFSDDNDLRLHLIRAGAVCFESKDGEELWGLLDRHKGAAFK
ncbi:hypothetical protein [Altererythrobacter lauratis]|uniref:Uncharacterized protein n=1 Tax=Alteraurantiacibacter lauratis TaxID=2054627 RepID=A0ABV7EII7_9SPHN